MKHAASIFLGLGLVAAGPAAADCPPAPDHAAPLNALIAQVQAAQTEGDARRIVNRMWDYWADAPDEQAQAILDRGMTRRAAFDLAGALSDFDRLIAYCPDYAEGYNQRAFVNFQRGDFETALSDLNRALDLSPRHIGALSGKALSLFGLGRRPEARAALAAALTLDPWLPERGLAAPGGPLAPAGEDI